MLGGLPPAVSAADETAAGSRPAAELHTPHKGTSVAKPTGSTQPSGSSLCRSVVPLDGLATLQWALGAVMPSSTHSTTPGVAGDTGRPGNGGMRSMPTCHEAKAGRRARRASWVSTGAVWQQQNRFRRGRLMRPAAMRQAPEGSLEGVPLGKIWMASYHKHPISPTVRTRVESL